MTETRTAVSHVFERTIDADIEDVWRALTEPDELQQSYYEHVVESTWMPGEPVRWRNTDDAVLMEGTVIDVDAPHRLVHSFAITSAGSTEAAGDAPTRVTYSLEQDDEGTRVTITHDGFEARTATWRTVEDGWEDMLDGLAGLFDEDDE